MVWQTIRDSLAEGMVHDLWGVVLPFMGLFFNLSLLQYMFCSGNCYLCEDMVYYLGALRGR
jgi:hypothetical protein